MTLGNRGQAVLTIRATPETSHPHLVLFSADNPPIGLTRLSEQPALLGRESRHISRIGHIAMERVDHAGAVLEVDDSAGDSRLVRKSAVPDAVVKSDDSAGLAPDRDMIGFEIVDALAGEGPEVYRLLCVQRPFAMRTADDFERTRIIVGGIAHKVAETQSV